MSLVGSGSWTEAAVTVAQRARGELCAMRLERQAAVGAGGDSSQVQWRLSMPLKQRMDIIQFCIVRRSIWQL